jgi:high affinity sulfate transporter 1
MTEDRGSPAAPGDDEQPLATGEPRPARSEYAGSRPRPFRAPETSSSRTRFVPLLADLRGTSFGRLRPDLIAGVTIAALAVPQGMAYAQTAGLPGVAGLYGLLLPVVAYGVLGSSRVLMTGPTATAALMVGPALVAVSANPATYPVLAAMLALLVGATFLVARVVRLGWISDYFSSAVLLGFLTGLALTLISGQLGAFFGVEVEGDTSLEEYQSFASNVLGQVDPTTLAVAGACLVALLAGGRWWPRFPTLLVVTIASIAASAAADLEARGVTLVGEIPAGLPSLAWPGVDLGVVAQLAPFAVGIALVAFSDAILTARSLARAGERPVDPDQEMIGLAGLNLMAGLSQSFPVGSSGSRSAVNVRIGGRTQVVSLAQAASVALVLLFLTAPLSLLPKATLAAVIVFAAIGLVDVGGWRALIRGSRSELAVAVITVLGMLAVGLLPALLIAVLLSIIDVVRRSAQPRDAVLGWSPDHGRFVDVQRRRDAQVVPGAVVYRLDDRLFFANTRYFRSRVREAVDGAPYPVEAFVFDAEAVTSIDTSGAQALRQVVEELGSRGVRLVVARARAEFEQQVQVLGLDDVLPESAMFPTVRAAVRAVTGVDVEGSP